MGTILLRTVIMYFIIIILFRIMGKREIGQLSVIDLVVSIMIAELAVVAIEDNNTSILEAVLPMAFLALIQITMSFISLKSQKLRQVLDGKPSVLIEQGKINDNEMKKQRYNFHDLLSQLREKNVSNLQDVEFAILEPSGSLSVITKDKQKEKRDASLIMPLPLILDGKIQEENLQKINKTPLWLRQQLRKLGYRDIKQISYCSFDEYNTFFVDVKDE